MKLSLRGEYALRALVALAESFDSEVIPVQVVSDQQEIPKRFLEQILNDLRGGGFVESKRGIAGGYRLARPMEEITMAEVIRHVEGALAPMTNLSKAPARLKPQAGGTQLAIRAVMKDVRDAMVKVLDGVTLGDLFRRSRELQSVAATPADYII